MDSQGKVISNSTEVTQNSQTRIHIEYGADGAIIADKSNIDGVKLSDNPAVAIIGDNKFEACGSDVQLFVKLTISGDRRSIPSIVNDRNLSFDVSRSGGSLEFKLTANGLETLKNFVAVVIENEKTGTYTLRAGASVKLTAEGGIFIERGLLKLSSAATLDIVGNMKESIDKTGQAGEARDPQFKKVIDIEQIGGILRLSNGAIEIRNGEAVTTLGQTFIAKGAINDVMIGSAKARFEAGESKTYTDIRTVGLEKILTLSSAWYSLFGLGNEKDAKAMATIKDIVSHLSPEQQEKFREIENDPRTPSRFYKIGQFLDEIGKDSGVGGQIKGMMVSLGAVESQVEKHSIEFIKFKNDGAALRSSSDLAHDYEQKMLGQILGADKVTPEMRLADGISSLNPELKGYVTGFMTAINDGNFALADFKMYQAGVVQTAIAVSGLASQGLITTGQLGISGEMPDIKTLASNMLVDKGLREKADNAIKGVERSEAGMEFNFRQDFGNRVISFLVGGPIDRASTKQIVVGGIITAVSVVVIAVKTIQIVARVGGIICSAFTVGIVRGAGVAATAAAVGTTTIASETTATGFAAAAIATSNFSLAVGAGSMVFDAAKQGLAIYNHQQESFSFTEMFRVGFQAIGIAFLLELSASYISSLFSVGAASTAAVVTAEGASVAVPVATTSVRAFIAAGQAALSGRAITIAKEMLVSGTTYAVSDIAITYITTGKMLSSGDILASFARGAALGLGIGIGLRFLGGMLNKSTYITETFLKVTPSKGLSEVLSLLTGFLQNSVSKIIGISKATSQIISFSAVAQFAMVSPIFTVLDVVLASGWESLTTGRWTLSWKGKKEGDTLRQLGQIALASPFEFAKMAIWLIPALGVGQVNTKFWGNIFGEGSKVTAFLEAFSTKHSLSNLIKSSQIFSAANKEVFQIVAKKIIAENLSPAITEQSKSVLVRFFAGLPASVDGAAFIATSLFATEKASYGFFKLCGASDESAQAWASNIAFAALFFVPTPYGHGVGLRNTLDVEKQNSILNTPSDAQTSGGMLFSSGYDNVPVQYKRFTQSEARAELLKEWGVSSNIDVTTANVSKIGGREALTAEGTLNDPLGAFVRLNGNIVQLNASEGSVRFNSLDIRPDSPTGVELLSGKATNSEQLKLALKDGAFATFDAGEVSLSIGGENLIVDMGPGKIAVRDGEKADILFDGVHIARNVGTAEKPPVWQAVGLTRGSTPGLIEDAAPDLLKGIARNILTDSGKIKIELLLDDTALKTALDVADRIKLDKMSAAAQELTKTKGLSQHVAEHFANEAMKDIYKDRYKGSELVKREVANSLSVGLNGRYITGERGLATDAVNSIVSKAQGLGVSVGLDKRAMLMDVVSRQMASKISADLIGAKDDTNKVAAILGVSDRTVSQLSKDGITLGKNISDIVKALSDMRSTVTGNSIELRAGQLDTVKLFLDRVYDNGENPGKVFGENPTAAGKTLSNIVIAKLMHSMGERVDIFLPNDLLVEQFFKQIVNDSFTNKDALEMGLDGNKGGRGSLTAEGSKPSIVNLDRVSEQYNRGEISPAELAKVLKETPVLIFTDKALFLRQQALVKGAEGRDVINKALTERMESTHLLIDEAHLYMKNVMDLIISGQAMKDDATMAGFEKSFKDNINKLVDMNLLTRSESGVYDLNITKLSDPAITVRWDDPNQTHVGFTEAAKAQLRETNIDISIAESILSGMKAHQAGGVEVDVAKELVKPISEATGATEYSRQFQDVYYIMGAGLRGGMGLDSVSLRNAAAQSITASAQSLFTILCGYSKVLAVSGTPPGEAILNLWGFGLERLGIRGGVEMKVVLSGLGEAEIPAIVKQAVDKIRQNLDDNGDLRGDVRITIAHDMGRDVAEALNIALIEQNINIRVAEVGQGGVEFLAKGGFKGQISITNRISLVGVDWSTNLVLITGGKLGESLILQGKGRPSRGGQYGEFIVVADQGWVRTQAKEIISLLKGNSLKPENAVSRSLKSLGENKFTDEELDKAQLELVQRYMDARAEGQVYVQTASQALRDMVISRIGKESSTETQLKFMEHYFAKQREVRSESSYQQINEGEQGYSGDEQLRNGLDITVETLKRSLATFDGKMSCKNALLKDLSVLEYKDIAARRTSGENLTSLDKATNLQQIVDIAAKYSDNIVPIAAMHGKDAEHIQKVTNAEASINDMAQGSEISRDSVDGAVQAYDRTLSSSGIVLASIGWANNVVDMLQSSLHDSRLSVDDKKIVNMRVNAITLMVRGMSNSGSLPSLTELYMKYQDNLSMVTTLLMAMNPSVDLGAANAIVNMYASLEDLTKQNEFNSVSMPSTEDAITMFTKNSPAPFAMYIRSHKGDATFPSVLASILTQVEALNKKFESREARSKAFANSQIFGSILSKLYNFAALKISEAVLNSAQKSYDSGIVQKAGRLATALKISPAAALSIITRVDVSPEKVAAAFTVINAAATVIGAGRVSHITVQQVIDIASSETPSETLGTIVATGIKSEMPTRLADSLSDKIAKGSAIYRFMQKVDAGLNLVRLTGKPASALAGAGLISSDVGSVLKDKSPSLLSYLIANAKDYISRDWVATGLGFKVLAPIAITGIAVMAAPLFTVGVAIGFGKIVSVFMFTAMSFISPVMKSMTGKGKDKEGFVTGRAIGAVSSPIIAGFNIAGILSGSWLPAGWAGVMAQSWTGVLVLGAVNILLPGLIGTGFSILTGAISSRMTKKEAEDLYKKATAIAPAELSIDAAMAKINIEIKNGTDLGSIKVSEVFPTEIADDKKKQAILKLVLNKLLGEKQEKRKITDRAIAAYQAARPAVQQDVTIGQLINAASQNAIPALAAKALGTRFALDKVMTETIDGDSYYKDDVTMTDIEKAANTYGTTVIDILTERARPDARHLTELARNANPKAAEVTPTEVANSIMGVMNSIPDATLQDVRNALIPTNFKDTNIAKLNLQVNMILRSTLTPVEGEEGMVTLPRASSIEDKVNAVEATLKDEVRQAVYANLARMMAGEDKDEIAKAENVGNRMAEIVEKLQPSLLSNLNMATLYRAACTADSIDSIVNTLKPMLLAPEVGQKEPVVTKPTSQTIAAKERISETSVENIPQETVATTQSSTVPTEATPIPKAGAPEVQLATISMQTITIGVTLYNTSFDRATNSLILTGSGGNKVTIDEYGNVAGYSYLPNDVNVTVSKVGHQTTWAFFQQGEDQLFQTIGGGQRALPGSGNNIGEITVDWGVSAIEKQAPPIVSPGGGGEIAKGWLKDRVDAAESIEAVFASGLVQKLEGVDKVVEDAVTQAIRQLFDTAMNRGPPAGISSDSYPDALAMLSKLNNPETRAAMISYFTARVEPITGHLLGFGKRGGIALAADVIEYLSKMVAPTPYGNKLIQEYILHEVLESVTPTNTHDNLYKITQREFFGYKSGENPLGLALSKFNDEKRAEFTAKFAPSFGPISERLAHPENIDALRNGLIGVGPLGPGIMMAQSSLLGEPATPETVTKIIEKTQTKAERLTNATKVGGVDTVSRESAIEITRMQGLASNGIAAEDMTYTIEIGGRSFDIALKKGDKVGDKVKEYIDSHVADFPDETIRNNMTTAIGKGLYEVAFSVGSDGKVAYAFRNAAIVFDATAASYDYKSTVLFNANTRWLIHSHPVMPANDAEFDADRANFAKLGDAGSMVILPDGSFKVLKMPAVPLAAFVKSGELMEQHTFTYANGVYSKEDVNVTGAYAMIEGVLRDKSGSLEGLFEALGKLHRASIVRDTVILAFDGNSVFDKDKGQLRGEFREALGYAEKNNNVARMVLIARDAQQQSALEKNVPGVSVVLVGEGVNPSDAIRSAMEANNVKVGNIAILLEDTDTGNEINMIGADAVNTREKGREGTLAYALINRKGMNADTVVAVEKINLTNLLASIIMKGAFVAIGYKENDNSIKKLSGYFGFFKIFRDVAEAISKMLSAMDKASRSA